MSTRQHIMCTWTNSNFVLKKISHDQAKAFFKLNCRTREYTTFFIRLPRINHL